MKPAVICLNDGTTAIAGCASSIWAIGLETMTHRVELVASLLIRHVCERLGR